MANLSNQEKSARRYETLTRIAELFADNNAEFVAFCWDAKEEKRVVTWRKFETFIKRKFEAGERVKIVIETGASGG